MLPWGERSFARIRRAPLVNSLIGSCTVLQRFTLTKIIGWRLVIILKIYVHLNALLFCSKSPRVIELLVASGIDEKLSELKTFWHTFDMLGFIFLPFISFHNKSQLQNSFSNISLFIGDHLLWFMKATVGALLDLDIAEKLNHLSQIYCNVVNGTFQIFFGD